MRRRKAQSQLSKDISYIIFGICLAFLVSKSGLLDMLLDLIGDGAIASFLSGIFFTSAFTIAPSSVAIARLAETVPIWQISIWGGFGALCGDLLLFFFIRDRFADDLKNSLKPAFVKHILHSFHLGFLKWFAPILGAAIIASPLPDELGLTLMGLSKTRIALLIPISFVMNALGIYLLASFASVI